MLNLGLRKRRTKEEIKRDREQVEEDKRMIQDARQLHVDYMHMQAQQQQDQILIQNLSEELKKLKEESESMIPMQYQGVFPPPPPQ